MKVYKKRSPRRTPRKRVTSKRIYRKRVASKRISRKRVASKRTPRKRVAYKRTSRKRAVSKRTSRKRAVSKRTSRKRVVSKRTPVKKVASKRTSVKHDIINVEQSKTQTHINNVNNANKLYNLYQPGYQFPAWTINYLYNEKISFFIFYNENSEKFIVFQIKFFGPLVKVFYNSKDNLNDVVKTVTERVPCNISMNNCFKTTEFKNNYGWDSSYYYRYYMKNKTLAPNIGVFCYTPVLYLGKITDVFIYNAIAFAFDDERQPDYQYFIQNNNTSKLLKEFTDVFIKIFYCAKDRRQIRTIIFSLIGLGAFSSLYPNIKDLFTPALNAAKEKMQYTGDIKFMGGNSQLYPTVGFFPEIITKFNPYTTLYVNAWDPHTFAGNGNNNDNSLDGHIGRSTAIALLCSPLTNPYINYSGIGM